MAGRRCTQGAEAADAAYEAPLPRHIELRTFLDTPIHLGLEPGEPAPELQLVEERKAVFVGSLPMGERVSGLEAYTHSWFELSQRDRSFDAAQARQVDVEERNSGASLQTELDRLGAVLSFEHDELVNGPAHG